MFLDQSLALSAGKLMSLLFARAIPRSSENSGRGTDVLLAAVPCVFLRRFGWSGAGSRLQVISEVQHGSSLQLGLRLLVTEKATLLL